VAAHLGKEILEALEIQMVQLLEQAAAVVVLALQEAVLEAEMAALAVQVLRMR